MSYFVLRKSSFSRKKKLFLCFLLLCLLILNFLFHSESVLYNLSIETFIRVLWPKLMLAKKLIFLHLRKDFHICRVSTFKVYAEGKSFTDYILTIVAEIYIIFRSELTRQMSNRPYSLVTDWSNDEAVIKNWILFRFVCLVIRKEKPLFTS